MHRESKLPFVRATNEQPRHQDHSHHATLDSNVRRGIHRTGTGRRRCHLEEEEGEWEEDSSAEVFLSMTWNQLYFDIRRRVSLARLVHLALKSGERIRVHQVASVRLLSHTTPRAPLWLLSVTSLPAYSTRYVSSSTAGPTRPSLLLHNLATCPSRTHLSALARVARTRKLDAPDLKASLRSIGATPSQRSVLHHPFPRASISRLPPSRPPLTHQSLS